MNNNNNNNNIFQYFIIIILVDALEHKVHGFGSISKNLGSWYVIPSMEWKNGGAVNRDLSCHQVCRKMKSF